MTPPAGGAFFVAGKPAAGVGAAGVAVAGAGFDGVKPPAAGDAGVGDDFAAGKPAAGVPVPGAGAGAPPHGDGDPAGDTPDFAAGNPAEPAHGGAEIPDPPAGAGAAGAGAAGAAATGVGRAGAAVGTCHAFCGAATFTPEGVHAAVGPGAAVPLVWRSAPDACSDATARTSSRV